MNKLRSSDVEKLSKIRSWRVEMLNSRELEWSDDRIAAKNGGVDGREAERARSQEVEKMSRERLRSG